MHVSASAVAMAHSRMDRRPFLLKRIMALQCISVDAYSLNVDVRTLLVPSIKAGQ